MNAPSRRLVAWLEAWSPTLLYTAMIFTLSSIPALAPPGGFKTEDKIFHLAEYGCWGLLMRRSLDRPDQALRGRMLRALAVVLLGAAMAWTDENFQRRVGREYSLGDMAADGAGVILAQPAFEWLRRRVNRPAAHKES